MRYQTHRKPARELRKGDIFLVDWMPRRIVTEPYMMLGYLRFNTVRVGRASAGRGQWMQKPSADVLTVSPLTSA